MAPQLELVSRVFLLAIQTVIDAIILLKTDYFLCVCVYAKCKLEVLLLFLFLIITSIIIHFGGKSFDDLGLSSNLVFGW